MHILLTRPLEDCSEMIVKFKSLGHQVSHLPLLSVEKVVHDETNFADFNGVIFTSANAVKFLNHDEINKTIKCFCVGEATEKKARSFGFQNTIAAEGNVSNLKELIVQNHGSSDGQLLYVSGERISVDLDQQLIKEDKIIVEAELFSLDGSKRYYEKKTGKLEDFSQIGREVGQILKTKSNNSYKR